MSPSAQPWLSELNYTFSGGYAKIPITKRAGWQWHRTRMTVPARATRLWLVSVFRQGWVVLLVALLRHEPVPQGRFVPEPRPVLPALEDQACAPARDLPEAA